MSISLIVSVLGAVLSAIGLGMLVPRCLRDPRGDLIAWSVALLGLLVALVAQALGHLAGFGQITFRAMEIGAQLVAPLALILGLAELAARALPGRFAARLFIPALAFVALVILTTDPLSGSVFTKAWPDPAVYYQIIPNKLLDDGLAPVSLLVALVLVVLVAVRAARESQWRAPAAAAAAAGAAVAALAVPGLAAAGHVKLPLSSLFALLCLLAAALTWYAAVAAARIPLAELRGAGSPYASYAGHRGAGGGRRGAARRGRAGDAEPDGWEQRGPWPGDGQAGELEPAGEFGQADDFGSYDDGSQGVYRGGGLYRDEPAGSRSGARPGDDTGYGWQDADGDYDSRQLDPAYGPGGYGAAGGGRAGYEPGSREAYDTEGRSLAQRAAQYAAAAADSAAADPAAQRAGPAGAPELSRTQLFGQIAIYTLLEDRVREFDRLTERVVGQVRAREPKTLVFIVHAVPSAPMQRILYEVYQDRAAFDWHENQPYVAEFEADRRPYVLATNVIELGLQQAKVSPFPSITDLFGEPGYDTSGFERPDYTKEYGSSAGQNGAPL